MGTLYLVATPIGNLEDITIRAIKTLFSVDYIACEDTRKTGQLIKNLEFRMQNSELAIKNLSVNKKAQLISYYDEIEFTRIPEIISLLEQGNSIALVSDAGTPLIADPGYKLVGECIKRNIKIISIPGPSSVLTALTSSGLPPDQFLFLGYLPPKSAKRRLLLDAMYRYIDTSKNIHPTIILLEAPHRLHESLVDIKEIYGDIEIVIARELTKIHEEIWRGKVSDALKRECKGEIVILFKLR